MVLYKLGETHLVCEDAEKGDAMRKFVYAGIIALSLASASVQAESPQQFRASIIADIAQRLPNAKLIATPGDELQIRVIQKAQDDQTINLDRIWQFCQNNDAATCAQVKSAFVAKILTPPPSSTRENLRVIVRAQNYVEQIKAMPPQADGSPTGYFRRIGDDLFAVLAMDSPQATGIVNGSQLKQLQLSEEQAWTLAEQQTAAHLPPLPKADDVKTHGVGFEGYDYLGSLLVQRAGFARLSQAVGPDLMVTVVSDGFVMVATLADGPNLDRFAKVVREDCKSQERCTSPHIYRFRDGGWRIADGSDPVS